MNNFTEHQELINLLVADRVSVMEQLLGLWDDVPVESLPAEMVAEVLDARERLRQSVLDVSYKH